MTFSGNQLEKSGCRSRPFEIERCLATGIDGSETDPADYARGPSLGNAALGPAISWDLARESGRCYTALGRPPAVGNLRRNGAREFLQRSSAEPSRRSLPRIRLRLARTNMATCIPRKVSPVRVEMRCRSHEPAYVRESGRIGAESEAKRVREKFAEEAGPGHSRTTVASVTLWRRR